MPQGSVLGHTLFVIYINDLVDNLVCTTKLYADDSKIMNVVRCQDDHDRLQLDLDHIMTWSNTWLMRMNVDKCVVISSMQEPSSFGEYLLGNAQLRRSDAERDLGIIMDKDLSFDQHIEAAASKADRMLNTLSRTFRSLNPDTWPKLYLIYVRPHLEYAIQAWRPYKQIALEKLERIQRRNKATDQSQGIILHKKVKQVEHS